VSKLAIECGWKVEKEMLRIPSTRNTALIGRHRDIPFGDVDTVDLVDENGGAICWEENALKLVKSAARGH
jgi:tRNASer (uridine44-2'-O)-methyltransferase